MLSRAKSGEIAAALLAAVVFALAACSSGAPGDSTPSSGAPTASAPDTTQAATTVPNTASTTTIPTTGASGQNNNGPLAWVPPGPVDPADPPQSQWYLLLEGKDCDGLAAAVETGNSSTPDGLALWGAATDVCRAVYQGQPSGWEAAAANLAPLQEPEPERCLDRAAYQLVAALLAAHTENPDASLEPVPGTGTACPLGLAGLDAQDGQGPTATPSSGLSGGTFQLAGRFIDVVAVMVGEQRVAVEADPSQPGRWDVVMPAAASPGAVTVTAESSAGPIPGSLTFTYVDGSGG